MKRSFKTWLASGCLALLAVAAAGPARAEVTPVPHVDLSRYLGTWYEIAAIPQTFQRQCVSNTRAEYALGEDDTVAVRNSCETAAGERSSAEGRARIEDPVSRAELKVTFVRLLGHWVYLFGGDYWVIDLEPSYRYAVVGHPDRAYGWILSRTPALAAEDLRSIARNLTAQGYDLCEFKMTRQDEGFAGTAMRLCDAVAAH